MNVLALEPYYGGSHRAFIDGWAAHSRHAWTVLGLRPSKWKWRMRHSAVTFADEVRERLALGERWDLIICSDMLNLAEFVGLAPRAVRDLPTMAYFHENQLTYPVQHETERDYHFGFNNMTTALVATGVWFNSAFNRDSFLAALPDFLKRMPDYQPLHAIDRIREKARIQPPGIEEPPAREPRAPGPLRILWAARWEHDKDPETFFDALDHLAARGVAFRVSVIGQRFSRTPPVFARAREHFRDQIEHWGFQPTRTAYWAALAQADVFVSTAQHEFFGISAVEAMAARAYPLLPRRLAYPELLSTAAVTDPDAFLYEGGATNLARHLAELAERLEAGSLWGTDPLRVRQAMERFTWKRLAPALDAGLDELSGGSRQ